MFLGKICNLSPTLKDFFINFLTFKGFGNYEFCNFELAKSNILLFRPKKNDFLPFWPKKKTEFIQIFQKYWLGRTRGNPVRVDRIGKYSDQNWSEYYGLDRGLNGLELVWVGKERVPLVIPVSFKFIISILLSKIQNFYDLISTL